MTLTRDQIIIERIILFNQRVVIQWLCHTTYYSMPANSVAGLYVISGEGVERVWRRRVIARCIRSIRIPARRHCGVYLAIRNRAVSRWRGVERIIIDRPIGECIPAYKAISMRSICLPVCSAFIVAFWCLPSALRNNNAMPLRDVLMRMTPRPSVYYVALRRVTVDLLHK